jgi:hypothetical protein
MRLGLGLSIGSSRRGGGGGGGGPSAPLAELFFLDTVALTENVTATFWDAPTGGTQVNAPVIYDILGKPSVVAQANTWVRFTPQTADEAYGTVLNPHRLAQSGSEVQGFDRRMETASTIKPTIRTPYIPALNIEAVDGPGLPLTAGRTYVKHVARTSFGDAGNALEYALLTVLDAQPVEGFFRPSTSTSNKSILANGAAVDYNVFRQLPDIAGQISLATALNYIPDFRFGNGYGGEILRNLSNDRAGTSMTYMSTSGNQSAIAYLRAHVGPNSDAEKRVLINRMIQIGLDRYADYLGGWRGGSGAGQFQKELECMAFAGFALKSTAILDAAKDVRQNVVGQCKWVPETAVGYSPGWPTGGGPLTNQRRWNPHFKPIHVGQPFLFQANTLQNSLHGMSILQRYLPTSSAAVAMGLFSVLLLQNGPGGITGLDWWLTVGGGNGTLDATNDRAAAVFWIDRYINAKSDLQITSWVRAMYAAHRGLIAAPVYSGPGITVETDTPGNEGLITATASGFNFDWTNRNWSTGTMDAVETRYSQDGVSFVTASASAFTGTVSEVSAGIPLTIQPHKVQMRYRNIGPNGQSYWSEFSPNYSYTDATGLRGDRLVVTPTGSRTNHAPIFVVSPSLFVPTNPRTEEPSYEPVSGTLSTGDMVIVAGAGYVDAHPAATLEYQLFVGGVAYGPRQASNKFTRDRGIASSTDVFVRVFATNGTEVFADTNTIQFPAPRVYADDIIIDTDFDPAFDAEWPAVRDSITGTGGTVQWLPFNATSIEPPGDLEITAQDIPQTTPGLIRVAKNASNPTMRTHLSATRPLVVGRKYRVEADLYSSPSAATPILFKLNTTGSGADIHDARIDEHPMPRIHKEVVEFTATSPNLHMINLYNTTSGGTSGGDPTVNKISVREIDEFTPGGGFPEPLPTPVVIYDAATDGFSLSQWALENAVSFDGTGFLFGSGAGWPAMTRTFGLSGAVIGQQVRVTTTAVRLSGSNVARLNIGRDSYVDPDYGTLPVSSGLYVSEFNLPTSLSTTTNVFRLQSTPNVRVGLNVRANTGGWRVNNVRVELL